MMQPVDMSHYEMDVLAAARARGLPAPLAGQVARHAAEEALAGAGRRAGPVLAACDLDRTLIYSAAALLLDPDDVAAPTLAVAEVHQRAPMSFWTQDTQLLIGVLSNAAVFVPTTTRTRSQFARIRFPGPGPRYAVTSNGGHLLVDGVTCPDWASAVADVLTVSAPLREVSEHLARTANGAWVRKRRLAEDLFTYLVVERDQMPAGFVRDLTGWAAERGWGVSVQGRKVYVVPVPLTKSAAVAEVARRTGASGRVVAAGDSLLDAELLEFSLRGFRPAHGELHEIGWSAAHVSVTGAVGVRAGQEIAGRMLAHALIA